MKLAESQTKTAVITGASSGIGAAAAVKFAENGWDLILLGRNSDRLHLTARQCSNVNVHVVTMDFNDTNTGEKKLEAALHNSKHPTVLVNNAGIFKTGRIQQQSTTDWNELFKVNLMSAVYMAKQLWPYFLKNGGGSIVNVSSTLGVHPTPDTSAYSALKAAMNNWTISLAQEGGPANIRVNSICPGIVDTPIHQFHSLPAEQKAKAEAEMSSLQLLNFIGKPEYIAESIYFMAAEKSKWTTGSLLHVDGGINIK